MDENFADDIRKGLTARNKYIPDKHFYDKRGSQLFQEFMRMEDYYLTDCEYEIFTTYQTELYELFNKGNERFHLIEFGAGDGLKTKVLLNYFLQKKAAFSYFPIDFSADILNELRTDLQHTFPALHVEPLNEDYFDALEKLTEYKNIKKVIFFIGNSLGNLTENESCEFLNRLSNYLNKEDMVFIGFDLKKDPSVIHKAYNDTCKPLCYNIFQRLNNELRGDFTPSDFEYYIHYNPVSGSVDWYFISKKEQTVTLRELHLQVRFKAWEPIYIGRSQKYDISYITELSEKTGFRIIRNFYDKKHYYLDSVWSVTNK